MYSITKIILLCYFILLGALPSALGQQAPDTSFQLKQLGVEISMLLNPSFSFKNYLAHPINFTPFIFYKQRNHQLMSGPFLIPLLGKESHCIDGGLNPEYKGWNMEVGVAIKYRYFPPLWPHDRWHLFLESNNYIAWHKAGWKCIGERFRKSRYIQSLIGPGIQYDISPTLYLEATAGGGVQYVNRYVLQGDGNEYNWSPSYFLSYNLQFSVGWYLLNITKNITEHD